MTDERLNAWLNFAKYAVIAGGVAIATTWINADLTQKEIELRKLEKTSQIELKTLEKNAEINGKIIEQEKQYLKDFLSNALDENLDRKYQFALFFKSLTYSNEFSKGWDEYFKSVDEQRKTKQKELEKEYAEIEGKSGLELKAAHDRIEALESELTNASSVRGEISTHPIPVANITKTTNCAKNEKLWIWPVEYEIWPLAYSALTKGIGSGVDDKLAMENPIFKVLKDLESLKGFKFRVLGRFDRNIRVITYCKANTGTARNFHWFDQSGNGHKLEKAVAINLLSKSDKFGWLDPDRAN